MKPTILIDMDDTIIATGNLYWDARHAAVDLIHAQGLLDSRPGIMTLIDAIDADAAERHGFGKDRFPHSLSAAYARLCDDRQVPTKLEIVRELRAIGYGVYAAHAPVLPGTAEGLARLARTHQLVLLTKGDREVQLARIDRLAADGYARYFAGYEIVPHKDEATLRDFLGRHQLPAATTWMIGDSIRSDINPALAVGMPAIHLTGRAGWTYEHAAPTGGHHAAADLVGAAEIVEAACGAAGAVAR